MALSQRSAVVAVGPLTPLLRNDIDLSAAATSLLTALPLLCFGAFALAAPALQIRFGLDRAMQLALTVVVVGIALRSVPSVGALFAGAGLLGVGIAVTNVLLPAVIKRDFASRMGLGVGLYSMLLNGGAALAAGTSIAIGGALHIGWRAALASWGLIPLLGLTLWALRGVPQHIPPAPNTPRSRVTPWQSRLAWSVSIYMALQSLLYYALIAWLPSLLVDAGMSQGRAGVAAATMSLAGLPVSLLIPVLAARMRTQRPLVLVSVGGFVVGLVGLLVAPLPAIWLWMIALGVGQGAGISLTLALFVLRTSTPTDAAALSGMAQTVGYLLAAAGPMLVGTLRDQWSTWDAPLVALIPTLVALTSVGWVAAAPHVVEHR